MTEFRLTTEWRIEASRRRVCDAVSACLDWPRWWKGAVAVEELEAGDADGVGSLRRLTWKGRLPYRLTFDARVTRVIPLTLLEACASGDVEGIGRWRFSDEGALTVVRYDWHVRINRRWMNQLALVAWPLFRWNHDQVMGEGAEGMARLLNARLVSLVHGGEDVS